MKHFKKLNITDYSKAVFPRKTGPGVVLVVATLKFGMQARLDERENGKKKFEVQEKCLAN